jgi:hypothetical protein
VGVAQGDGQEDDAPQPLDGEVVAAAGAGGAEALEQVVVGDGVAEVLDGLEAGAVLRPAPGEEGRGGVERWQGAAPSR